MTQMRTQTEILQDQIDSALADENVPRIYFNGFAAARGTGDVFLLLRQNNGPVAILNTSYTVAKTLAMILGRIIADLEERSGNTIMTTGDIEELSREEKGGNGVGE